MNKILLDEAYLTTKEAAAELRITPNALRIMVFRNQVKYYKRGKFLRFKLNDLRNLYKEAN